MKITQLGDINFDRFLSLNKTVISIRKQWYSKYEKLGRYAFRAIVDFLSISIGDAR